MVRANFSGYWGPGMQLEVISAWNTPNNEGNFSTVNVQVFLITDGYTSLNGYYPKPLTVRVGDIVDVSQQDAGIGPGQRKLLLAKDYRVNHDNDGRKTIGVAASFEIHIQGFGFASVGFDLKLQDIPRASKGPAIDSVIGKPITLNIQKASPEFRHYIHVYFGNWASNITGETPADTSFTWTPPMELCEQIPDALSGIGTIYYLTYKNGKEVGRDWKQVKLSVPDSVVPSLTGISVSDTNQKISDLIRKPNTFVSVLSKLKVAFAGASGAYGSKIARYSTSIVDKPYSTYDKEGYIGEVTHVGKAKIRATVTDTRGRTSSPKEIEVDFLDYFLPQISFSATRVGANADQIQVTRNTKVAPLTVNGSQKNTMRVSFKVAPFGSANYTDDNGPATASFTSVSSLVNSTANLGRSYGADRSYVIIGKVEDKFSSSEYRVEIATRSVVMSMDKTGVGIGKIRERGTLDVAGDVYANKVYANNIQQYQLTQSNGMLNRGGWNQPWNVQATTMDWRDNRHADHPIGNNGQWGLFQNYWLDTWKGVQFFTDFGQGRHFLRYYNNSRVWAPSPWKEFVFKDDPSLIKTTDWQPAGFKDSFYKRVGDVLSVRFNFVGNGGNIQFADIPLDIFKAPQSYMFVVAGWGINGGDGNIHVQVNNDTGTFHALATHNGVSYIGQLTVMI
nr:MAG TPA: protein of unknown function DUF859 [Caudoviricetes sp.]